MSLNQRTRRMERTRQMAVFAMLGTIMFVSKLMMEFLPNMHLVGMLTVVYTMVYRQKALIPLYIFVVLNGLYVGFALWWVPYLYLWTILWGAIMLLPRKLPMKLYLPICIVVCGLHGLLFGVLYAPFQAIAFGLSWKQMLAWIAAGFAFDVIHGISNCVAGVLIYPLYRTLQKLEEKHSIGHTVKTDK